MTIKMTKKRDRIDCVCGTCVGAEVYSLENDFLYEEWYCSTCPTCGKAVIPDNGAVNVKANS